MRKKTVKMQSAMEYLMTYGWAILVIGVVIVVLYQLGVFNFFGSSLPKGQAGGCQVIRQNGVNTTLFESLQGICSSIPPQFVGVFAKQYSWINASQASYTTGNIVNLTVSAWILQFGNGPGCPGTPPRALGKSQGAGTGPLANVQGWWINTACGTVTTSFCAGNGQLLAGGGRTCVTSGPLDVNHWYFVTAVIGGNTISEYINGTLVGSAQVPGNIVTTRSPFLMGASGWGDSTYASPFNGLIADVQLYNSTFNANSIVTLFNRGIGGAPTKLSSLVGWWPLNGDIADYSGDLLHGVPSNVAYTTYWIYDYSVP